MRQVFRIAALLLCLWPVTALAQDDDKGILTRFLEDTLSSAGRTIEINGFEGALSSRATVAEIIVADDAGPWLTLRGIVLDWNRSAVLRGRVEINELLAEEILIPRLPNPDPNKVPSPAASEPFSLPDLPVSIDIGNIAARRVVLGEALFGEGAEVTLNGALSLIGGDGKSDISVERIDGQAGVLNLDAEFVQDSGQLTVDLALEEGPGGIAVKLIGVPDEPAVALTIQGDAPISDFESRVRLTTDGQERLAGTIALSSAVAEGDSAPTRGFRVDLAGDLAPLLAPDYRPFFGDNIALAANGRSSPDGITALDTFTLRANAIDLSGSAVIGANGLPLSFDIEGLIEDSGAPVLLPTTGEQTRVTRAQIDATFDAAQGERWTAIIALDDLEQEELSLAQVRLDGAGTISGTDGTSTRRVDADLTFAATGFQHVNADLQTALGTDFNGAADLIWQDGERLVLNSLMLGGEGYGLDASAEVDGLSGAFAIDGTATASVADLSRFAGLAGQPLSGAAELRIAGTAALLGGAFDVTVDLTGTDLGIGNAELDRLLSGTSTVSLAAERDTGGLTIERLVVDAQELQANLSGDLGTDAGAFDLTARLTEIAPYAPGLSGPVTVDGTAILSTGTWTLNMDATAPGGTTARIDGTVSDLDGDLAVTGRASANIAALDAYAGLANRTITGAISFTAEGSGAIVPRRFDVTLDATGEQLAIGIAEVDRLIAGTSTLGLTARGDTTEVQIDRFEIDTNELTAALSGTAGPEVGRFDLTARLAEIAAFVPGLSGPVTVDGQAALDAGTWTLNMDADAPGGTSARIDGTLSDLDGDLSVAGTVSANISGLDAYADLAGRPLSGGITLRAMGAGAIVPRSFDLSLDATGDDLAIGIAQLDGLLAGQSTFGLTASGDLDAARIDRFALVTPQITADASGTLNTAGTSALDLTARLADLGAVLDGLNGPGAVTGTARQDGTEWTLDIDATGPGALTASVDGTVDYVPDNIALAGRAQARIGDLGAYSAVAGRSLGGALSLTAEGQGALSDGSFDVTANAEGTSLRTGIAEVDRVLNGQSTVALSAARDGTTLTLRQLDVNTSQLTASLDGVLDEAVSRFTLDARLADLAIFAPGFAGPATIAATAAHQGARWQIDGDATGPGQTSAALSGTVSQDFQNFDLGVTGQAALGLANRFIEPRTIEGTGQFDLRLNGAPALASVSGTIRTGGARVALPELDFALTDLAATITLSQGTANIDLNTLGREGGQILVIGPVTLSAPYNADLGIQLRSLVLTDPTLYDTSINGGLSITGPLTGNGQISGTIDLGRTEVKVPSSGLGGGGYIPDDIRHIAEPASVRTTRRYAGLLDSNGNGTGGGGSGGGLGLDLLINATNPIFLRGRGLDAEFGGSLRISGTTGQVIPIGRFDLRRGRLDLLGERLIINEGYAQLQGDFVPFVYLEATSQTDTILVRIIVEGPADEPEIRFESEPELPDDEVLAQFLFGRDLTQLSAFQAAQLASAVATLAGRGGAGIVARLRDSFGLDDFDVSSDEDGATTVRAGKYLTENVYSDVLIDETGKSEVTINLDLTDSFTIRGSTKTDGETGLGVFFERDY